MSAQTDEVERLVAIMQTAVPQFGEFQGQDGMSAALTFAIRFAKTLVTLSPPERRKELVEKLAQSFVRSGAMFEFDMIHELKQTVH